MIGFTKNSGFGLIGILIVIAVVALAGGGGLYLKKIQNQKNITQIELEAKKKALELVNNINSVQESKEMLPLDPGEAGKQTIAGIDTDGDGVRDDIERYIALTYPESARTRAALTQIAVALQVALLASNNRDASLAAASARLNAIDCLLFIHGTQTGRARFNELRAQILNTEDRTRAYITADNQLGGQVFEAGIDTKSLCNFDPDKMPN